MLTTASFQAGLQEAEFVAFGVGQAVPGLLAGLADVGRARPELQEAFEADRSKPLTWIQIGSVAGPAAQIPSAALRAARLQIVGSGQGSVSTREILAELPALAQEITKGTFEIDARPTSLAQVEQAWSDAAHTTQLIVLTPQGTVNSN